MKFLSMLVFIVLSTALFALMILRAPVEGNAMNLGIPENSLLIVSTEEPEVEEIKIEEENVDDKPKETEASTSETPDNIETPIAEAEMETEETKSEEISTD